MAVKKPRYRVLVLDKIHAFYHRTCPILEKKITKCPTQKNGFVGCLPYCSITNGFGGAGAYSDGKFNITSEYGGWMNEYLDEARIEALIRYADAINLKFGAPEAITDPTTEKVKNIERRGLAVGLKLLRGQVRHLGTDVNLQILKNIYEFLKDKITMMYKTEVEDIILTDGTLVGVRLIGGEIFNAPKVVVAPGRDGSQWLANLCQRHKIPMKANHVDIGVRVESSNEIMEEINENLYEGKFIYRTSSGSQARTF